jgi:hypothetical protein
MGERFVASLFFMGAANVQQPPPGVTFEENGEDFVLTAALRSPDVLIRVAASCIFGVSLIYAVFGCDACGFRNSRSSTVVTVIFLIILANAINRIFGRIVISRRGDRLEVVRAIGPFNKPQTIPWPDILEIREEIGGRKRFGGRRKYIAIVACPKLTSGVYTPAQKVRFGSLLADERREFLLKVLQSRQPSE